MEDKVDQIVKISLLTIPMPWTPAPWYERQSQKPKRKSIMTKAAFTNVPDRDTLHAIV